MDILTKALQYVTDPVYIVLLILIFLQQRQIATLVIIIKDYASSIAELSTLIKIKLTGKE